MCGVQLDDDISTKGWDKTIIEVVKRGSLKRFAHVVKKDDFVKQAWMLRFGSRRKGEC